MLPTAISTPNPSGAAPAKLMSMCLLSGHLGAILRRRNEVCCVTPTASSLRMPPFASCSAESIARHRQETAALRDFHLAYDSYGADSVFGHVGSMSGLPDSGHVRYRPHHAHHAPPA